MEELERIHYLWHEMIRTCSKDQVQSNSGVWQVQARRLAGLPAFAAALQVFDVYCSETRRILKEEMFSDSEWERLLRDYYQSGIEVLNHLGELHRGRLLASMDPMGFVTLHTLEVHSTGSWVPVDIQPRIAELNLTTERFLRGIRRHAKLKRMSRQDAEQSKNVVSAHLKENTQPVGEIGRCGQKGTAEPSVTAEQVGTVDVPNVKNKSNSGPETKKPRIWVREYWPLNPTNILNTLGIRKTDTRYKRFKKALRIARNNELAQRKKTAEPSIAPPAPLRSK